MEKQQYFTLAQTRYAEERKGSGVASGQVKTTKYVVFRNVATSFFTRYVCDFHEKHQQSTLWVRIMCSYVNSITLPDGVLQGELSCSTMAYQAVLWLFSS